MIHDLKLDITFPKGARQKPGFFILATGCGTVLLTGFCLGKADSQKAIREGNASRSQILPYGDAPTGDYAPAVVVDLGYTSPSLGSRWIPWEGAAGAALQARQGKDANGMPKKKRSGLGGHAGRGSDHLIPTHGCVRFKQDDFDVMCALIGSRSIEVTITESLI